MAPRGRNQFSGVCVSLLYPESGPEPGSGIQSCLMDQRRQESAEIRWHWNETSVDGASSQLVKLLGWGTLVALNPPNSPFQISQVPHPSDRGWEVDQYQGLARVQCQRLARCPIHV